VQLNREQVRSTAYAAGFRGEGLAIAIAICYAESGGVTDARNPQPGNVDRGLWQISSRWHPEVTDAQADFPLSCAKAAYAISSNGTNWHPWSTWHQDTNGREVGDGDHKAAWFQHYVATDVNTKPTVPVPNMGKVIVGQADPNSGDGGYGIIDTVTAIAGNPGIVTDVTSAAADQVVPDNPLSLLTDGLAALVKPLGPFAIRAGYITGGAVMMILSVYLLVAPTVLKTATTVAKGI
jgi:Lysozyme like domain